MALSGCTTVPRDTYHEDGCTDKHAAKLKGLGEGPSVDDVVAYNNWVAAYGKEVDAYNACLK
jgi:hypothetical protein